MILSHSRKFIFIHIYKTGGTSIRKELTKYDSLLLQTFRLYRFISREYQIFSNKYPRHITAYQLQQVLDPEVFDNYFKFAFVRNPWDWHVSNYHYIVNKKVHHQHKIFKNKSFQCYLEYVLEAGVTLQKDMLCNPDGELLVNYVGKMENLNRDFEIICETLGLPRKKLPHLNKGSRKSYQSYYPEKARELIAHAYKDDIEFFNYSF